MTSGGSTTPLMGYEPIRKHPGKWTTAPNLQDYAGTVASFTWEQARELLSGLPGGRGLNIAYEAVDRHADNGLAAKTAIRWISKEMRSRTSARDLKRQTDRFANVLAGLGGGGDRVYALAGRIPGLCRRARSRPQRVLPPSSAFGPEPSARLSIGGARVLVTTEALYKRRWSNSATSCRTLSSCCSCRYPGPTDVRERWTCVS
jgi:acetyl-CoA synthetase